MIDGSSGVDIGQILQSPTPDTEIHEAPAYIPRPAPTSFELARDSLTWRLGVPFRALRGLREFRRETSDLSAEVALRARALRDMFVAQNASSSATPFNRRVGPHRAFDWWSVPLADVKAIRKALDCTVNDVVLTVVTGAFREFLARRQVRPDEIDFRVQAPVSVRRPEEQGKLGNRVSAWLIRLPLDAADPREQLRRIHETTQDLKESQQALGVDMMMSLMEVMPTALLSLGAQAASGSMNSIVHQRSRAAVPAVPARRTHARDVSPGPAAAERGPRHRAHQLRRRDRLGLQCRCGARARSRELREARRGIVRARGRCGRREARHGGAGLGVGPGVGGQTSPLPRPSGL